MTHAWRGWHIHPYRSHLSEQTKQLSNYSLRRRLDWTRPHCRNDIKRHRFAIMYFTGRQVQISDSLALCYLLEAVQEYEGLKRLGPALPITRWVAFQWALWTPQLDKHSTAHSACLAAVWSARPRRDPWLHSICRPLHYPAPQPPSLSHSVGK